MSLLHERGWPGGGKNASARQPSSSWYPNLEAKLEWGQHDWRYQVAQSLRLSLDRTYMVRDTLRELLERPPWITQEEAEKRFGSEAMSQELSIAGDNPLNIAGLLGNFPGILRGTHAERPSPSSLDPGNAYWETDRTVLYVLDVVSGSNAWVYVAGIMEAALSSRPSDLSLADDGFMFHASDQGRTHRWTGTAWMNYTELGIGFDSTHVNRYSTGSVDTAGTAVTRTAGGSFQTAWAGRPILINNVRYTIASVASGNSLTLTSTAGVQAGVTYHCGYFSVDFQDGVVYWETDRTSWYMVQDASGTVDTNGTAVTWVSGDLFHPTWAGQSITINGVVYTIASAGGASTITLTASAGVQAGVAYSLESGKWQWVDGEMSGTHATDQRPTDLGYHDTGFLFLGTDRPWTWRWSGAAWILQEHRSAAYRAVRASRPSTGIGTDDAGARFYATDHTVQWRWSGAAWVYELGVRKDTAANITTSLGTSDAGYLFRSTDYGHRHIWTGAAWDFDGDNSAYCVVGRPDGSAPSGGLWGACSGAAYDVMLADGTVSSITTQDMNGDGTDPVFITGFTATAAPAVAARATWEAAAKTDKAVTGITVDTDVHTTDLAVLGAGTQVLTGPVDHTVTITEPNGAAGHEHTLSDSVAQLKVPNEANGGLPLRVKTVWYIRR